MKYIKLFEEFGKSPDDESHSGNTINSNLKEVQSILDEYYTDYINHIYRDVKIKLSSENSVLVVKMNQGIYIILDSILKGEDTPYTLLNNEMGEDIEKFEVTLIFKSKENKEIPITIKISDEEYDFLLFED